jgi:hypothetical protein
MTIVTVLEAEDGRTIVAVLEGEDGRTYDPTHPVAPMLALT